MNRAPSAQHAVGSNAPGQASYPLFDELVQDDRQLIVADEILKDSPLWGAELSPGWVVDSANRSAYYPMNFKRS